MLDYLLGPKSTDKCPYKRQRRNLTKREAEIGGMRPQAKELVEPSGAGRGRTDRPREP